MGCKYLEEIVIPDIQIAPDAFDNCSNLSEIDASQSSTLPNFSKCPLTQITISNKITQWTIDKNSTQTLNYINFLGTQTEWKTLIKGKATLNDVLVHCSDGDISWKPLSLKSLEGANEISERLFDNRLDLHKILIPSSIKEIKDFAFSGCSNLTVVDLNKVEIIGTSAFQLTAISEITIPKTVTDISRYAFDLQGISKISLESNSALTELDLSEYRNLKEIIVLSPVQLKISKYFNGQLTIVPKTELLFKKSDWQNVQSIIFKGLLQEWKELEKDLDTYPQQSIQVTCLDGTATLNPAINKQIYTLSHNSNGITARKKSPFWGETAPMGDGTGRFYWTSMDDAKNFADKYNLAGAVIGKSSKTKKELTPYVKLPEDNVYIMTRFADKWNK